MKYLLVSIASLCILSSATGLTCYNCAGPEDCEENLVECDILRVTAGLTQILGYKPSLQVIPSANFQCFKMVVEPQSTKAELYMKGCTYAETDVCAGTPILAEQKQCRTCTDNACNGTSRFVGSAGLGLLVAMVLTLWGGHCKL